MRFRVFTVFDQKAVAYLPPFCLPEVGMATRVFKDMVNDPKHELGRHPEDYTLFEVAGFDNLKGAFDSYDGPEMICTGLSVLDQVGQPDLELVGGS